MVALASCGTIRISVLSVPAAGHRATNSIGEVRLLAERPIYQRRVLTRGALPLSRGLRHKPPKLVAQVRFLAGAPQEGNAGLALWREHRRDTPDQVSSILTPCTVRRFTLTSMWRNWQPQRSQTPFFGGSTPPMDISRHCGEMANAAD